MKNKSHISPEIRSALAQHSPEIRRGVLAVADAGDVRIDPRSAMQSIGTPADTALKEVRRISPRSAMLR
jgi:hypothetical protein